jgi:DedD protein
MAEAQDIDALKRRGRRRLVGAVALVLLAVIVLPMVFDPEPRRATPPVSVRIPSEDDSGFAPKVTPKGQPAPAAAPAPKPAEPAKPQAAAPATAEPPKAAPATAEPPKAAPATAEPPKAAPAPEGKPQEAERARAQAALGNVEYVVQVAALANADTVKEVTAALAAARLPYYTEVVPVAKGKVTRVRAGPFATREAAEKARNQMLGLEKLKALGLKPASVAAKAG